MSTDLTDLHLLHELEPVVEANLNRHLSVCKDWNPHDYIPWSDGRNYYALGGKDWDPEQFAAIRCGPGGNGGQSVDRGQSALLSP